MIWKYYIIRYGIEPPKSYSPSGMIIGDGDHRVWLKRAIWLMDRPLPDSFSLFRIRESLFDYLNYAILAWLGPTVGFIADKRYDLGSVARLIFRYAALLLLLGASFAPVIFSGAPYSALRYQSVLAIAVLAMVSTSIFQVARLFGKPAIATAFLALIALFAVANANRNVLLGFALPHCTEFRHMRNSLSREIESGKEIHGVKVILPDVFDQYSGRMQYDEFGLTSSVAPINVPAMVRWALHDIHMDTTIPVQLHYNPGRGWDFRPNTKYRIGLGEQVDTSAVVIDMRYVRPAHWGNI